MTFSLLIGRNSLVNSRLFTLSHRCLHRSRLFSQQQLQREYTTSSTHSTGPRPHVTSRAKNIAFLTVVLSTAGLSAFLYEGYFSPKLHADTPTPSRLQIRKILHAQKEDTLHGVNIDHMLTRCEETVLHSGPGVWRYDLNQIAR